MNLSIPCEIDHKWVPRNPTDDKSISGQVKAWCHQATNHYHTQCWHEDVFKWKHFPHYWPFLLGIYWSLMNPPHKGQWREALLFSLNCTWTYGWVNNWDASDLRCHRGHFDFTVMDPDPCHHTVSLGHNELTWWYQYNLQSDLNSLNCDLFQIQVQFQLLTL